MTRDDLDRLDKAKLVDACRTALNCFRAMSAALEGDADADDLLASARYWPLSLLKHALGDDSERAMAEANWRGGRYIGTDDGDDTA
ncbi:MAG: hypothetical protein ABGY75_01105 [Gemmataceae bacterium]